MYSFEEYKGLPDNASLAALRAVVERGGVNEAARVLHIGQPAVTKRLRALERCYDQPLFMRAQGRLRLTEAGERVFQLAVRTLDQHRHLIEEIRNLAQGTTTMRLETTQAISEHLLPDLLIRFQDRFPNFKIESRLEYGRQIQNHLAAGLAHLGLMENAPDHPNILVQKWMDDELWLVCGRNHPLAAAGRHTVEMEALADFDFALRERRASLREDLDTAMKRYAIPPLKIALEVGSTDAIVEILDRKPLLSFLPRFSAIDWVEKGRLVHLIVPRFFIARTLWVCRSGQNLNNPVMRAFVDMLQTHTIKNA